MQKEHEMFKRNTKKKTIGTATGCRNNTDKHKVSVA